jgi:hypothetical protein
MTVLFAQGPDKDPQPHKHHPKLCKEAKSEIKTLNKEKIYPAKKAAHDQFLAGLSEEDLAFLDIKRAEEKTLKEAARSIQKKIRALKESGMDREQMREKAKESFAPLKEKRTTFMQSMKPFMERNKESLRAILEPMKEQHEMWKTEKKAIIDKYMTDEDRQRMEEQKKKKEEKHAEHPEKSKKKEMHKKHMGAVKFVLWDGEMKKKEECKKGERECNKGKNKKERNPDAGTFTETVNSTVMNVSNYPNPAMTQTTLIFELKENIKKVKVSIADIEGKLIWKKNYNKMSSGEQKIDIDLRKFTNGQYFYSIEAGEEQITKTMIVNK